MGQVNRSLLLRNLCLLGVSTALFSYLGGCTSSSTMPSNNYDTRVRSLVIHFTAIDYEKSVHALVDEGGLSSHYLLPESQDPSYPHTQPKVLQLVDEQHRAWHAGKSYWQGRTNLNDSSIGIELVNVPDCEWDEQLSSGHPEYGPSRLCVFPDYDPQQIEQLIELTQGILERNPDIHPTAVVGHADIAFGRKSDPGPRFPWHQLYEAGIGAWYDNETLSHYWRQFNQRLPSVEMLQSALKAYGYGIVETGILDSQTRNALSAFQMHFLPWAVSGQPDSQTHAAIFALLEKYFPAQADKLMGRYQRETELAEQHSLNQTPMLTRQGQIDRWYPEPEPSSRQFVNGRAAFKAYAGRGELYLQTSADARVSLNVNGETLNLDEPLVGGQLYHYSLARRTHSGLNTLSVGAIEPEDAEVRIRVPYPTLASSEANKQYQFEPVDTLIEQDIEAGFPGAVLLVIKDGAIIKHSAYGYASRYNEQGNPLPEPAPMRLDTQFDLASNTKVFATTLALMHLSAQGKLDLTAPVNTYLPEYQGEGREARRVKDLLTHQSGYAPEVKFFDPDNALGEGFYSQQKQRTGELLTSRVPFRHSNGTTTQYSDTNFMLLGLIVERLTGMPLDQYCETQLYAPLGLHYTRFTPLRKGARKNEFAATELAGNSRNGAIQFPDIRTHTLQGEVHDEKAYYAMQGVSGHAGLFSNASDMAVLLQLLLNGGGYGEVQLFDPATLQTFTRPNERHHNYGLGWRRAGNGESSWHFGPYASASAFGHTGWTGTVTVIDPELDLGIVLLTNARHTPIEPDDNGNPHFLGSDFETGKYGSLIALVYEAVLNSTAAGQP